MRWIPRIVLLLLALLLCWVGAQVPTPIPPLLNGHDGNSPMELFDYWSSDQANLPPEVIAATIETWEGPDFMPDSKIRSLTIKRWVMRDEAWAAAFVTHPSAAGTQKFPGFNSIVGNASFSGAPGRSSAVFVKGRTVVRMELNAKGVPSDYFVTLTELLAPTIEGGPVLISPPPPTTETLPATKDAIIDNFDPNGNEGANGGAGQRRKILLQGTAESDMTRALCLNACAYDAQYYYMPFDAVKMNSDNPLRPGREIHRIARSDWNTHLSRVEWTQTPKKVGSPVRIPQVGGP